VAIRFAAAVWVKCSGPKPPKVGTMDGLSFRPTHHQDGRTYPSGRWALHISEENGGATTTEARYNPPRTAVSNFPRFTLPFPCALSLLCQAASVALLPLSTHTHNFSSHTQQLPPRPFRRPRIDSARVPGIQVREFLCSLCHFDPRSDAW
jgi:hypothetical protein